MKEKVTGVRFQEAGKIYDFEPAPFELQIGDHVVVETQNGEEMAQIAYVNKSVEDQGYEHRHILRKATKEDLDKVAQNAERANKSLFKVKEIVKNSGLEMSVSSVVFSFNGDKVTVNFTSNERVDFRELLKELGAYFKKRVELRQIGIRDETKLVGGLGVCGQPCCCKRFLDDFGHVSVKMAKNQNLSLNPTKISGLCGRLMCCLAYENEFYQEAQQMFPKMGSNVKTPNGEGKLVSVNLLEGTGRVRFVKGDETTLSDFPANSISPCENCNANCPNAKNNHSKDKNADRNKSGHGNANHSHKSHLNQQES